LALTPSKSVYYCHHAQVGGDVISLAGHILGLSMKDAAEWLQDTLPDKRDVTVPQKPEGRTAPVAQPAPPAPQKQFDPDAYAAKLTYDEHVAALGISEEDAAWLSIGYCSTGLLRGRVAFPIR